MGFFDRAIGVLGASYPADHDFWYHPVGTVTAAGITLTAEGAQKVSAFYRGVDILSTSLAMLPLNVYRRLPGDAGADVAREHYLYDVLHNKPNQIQTSFHWRREAMRRLIVKGNHFSWIVAGRRGFADQLQPIYADVKPERTEAGRKIFRVRQKDGTFTTHTQDEIFHLCGCSDDGVEGVGVVQWAKDSIGLALATETYASKLFSQGNNFGLVLEAPGRPDEELAKSLRDNFQQAHSGLANAHKAAILFGGIKATRPSMTGEETQFIASRQFSINDIARWLGLPPHMLGSLERSTNNNIEHQGQEFVTYSLGPWLTLFEQSINDQLIVNREQYYVEFVRDALVRGDLAARWQAYHTAVTDGVVTRNEVRRKENWKSLPGLDEPLTPAHIIGKQDTASRAPEPSDDEDDDEPPAAASPSKAERIAQESAARVLRKEIAAVSASAVRHASDEDAFVGAVTAFYDRHAALVASTLQLTEAAAREYCAGQAHQVIGGDWTRALELWQTPAYAAGVAAIALEEAA